MTYEKQYRVGGSRKTFTLADATARANAVHAATGVFVSIEEVKTSLYKVEVTDTFGGDANYCWLHRHLIRLPEGATDRAIVKAAKAAEGWTGWRCETADIGGTIEVRPRGAAMVMFVDWIDDDDAERYVTNHHAVNVVG